MEIFIHYDKYEDYDVEVREDDAWVSFLWEGFKLYCLFYKPSTTAKVIDRIYWIRPRDDFVM